MGEGVGEDERVGDGVGDGGGFVTWATGEVSVPVGSVIGVAKSRTGRP